MIQDFKIRANDIITLALRLEEEEKYHVSIDYSGMHELLSIFLYNRKIGLVESIEDVGKPNEISFIEAENVLAEYLHGIN